MNHDLRGFMSGSDLHRECWDLLPWLANERASAKDQARIEGHLRECAECQRELANQKQLRDAVRAEDAVVIAPQTSLQKLMQRIDQKEVAATAAAPEVEATDTPTSRETVVQWPRWLGVAAAVQGIAIIGLVAALWMQALEAPRFTTLTSSAPIPQGPVIRVVFADGVALNDVSAILRSINAQVVAGPSEAGVYTLTLSSDDSRAAAVRSQVDSALATLRADDRVVFSEPAIAKGGTR